MASPGILDFESLLGPIAGDHPAGESLRLSQVYDGIKEARRADEVLPETEGDIWKKRKEDIKISDWRAVCDLCQKAIATQSKDIQIAVWLTEALVNWNGTGDKKWSGFAGLRDGFRLLRNLQEQYWEGLYPEIEDGELDLRAGPLRWLNEKFPLTVRSIALTSGSQVYAWNHWDESRRVDNLGRQDPEAMVAAIADGKITGEQFNKTVQETPRQFYETLFADLEDARTELGELEKVVDEKFGRDAPSLIKLRNMVDECHTLVGDILKTKRAEDPTYQVEPQTPSATNGAGDSSAPLRAAATVSFAGEPRSREEAFQRLAVIAHYLRRVEPQHPVSYLLERALRWTNMRLEEWLAEVIRNEDVLGQLRDTLGIKDRKDA